MIAHLRGRVSLRRADAVVVDVNGVGYLVHVASLDRIPPRGDEVELVTSLQVREDSMTLYGFPDAAGLELFDLLLTSSGVGPKLALAALRTLRPDVLRTAIATADTATLATIPGIGKKVAQRLVLELRDKVGAASGDVVLDDAGLSTGELSPLAEAREALRALGYSAGEAQSALADLDSDADTSTLLRQALRRLGTGVGAASR